VIRYLAAIMPAMDCERAAANKFDDGHRPIAKLAEQVMSVCIRERLLAMRTAGVSPLDTPVSTQKNSERGAQRRDRPQEPAKFKLGHYRLVSPLDSPVRCVEI
jgi:hypothetical protein